MTNMFLKNTSQAGDGMSVTIAFDKHSNTWIIRMEQKLLLKSWVMIHGNHTKSGDLGGIIRGTICTQMLRLLSIRNQ